MKANPTIGQRIAAIRKLNGLNQSELARKVGVSHNAIRQVEIGGTHEPTCTHLYQIADALHISARWLVTGKK